MDVGEEGVWEVLFNTINFLVKLITKIKAIRASAAAGRPLLFENCNYADPAMHEFLHLKPKQSESGSVRAYDITGFVLLNLGSSKRFLRF